MRSRSAPDYGAAGPEMWISPGCGVRAEKYVSVSEHYGRKEFLERALSCRAFPCSHVPTPCTESMFRVPTMPLESPSPSPIVPDLAAGTREQLTHACSVLVPALGTRLDAAAAWCPADHGADGETLGAGRAAWFASGHPIAERSTGASEPTRRYATGSPAGAGFYPTCETVLNSARDTPRDCAGVKSFSLYFKGLTIRTSTQN